MRIVLCPDKFKGTASAPQVVEALSRPLRAAGHQVVGQPMADGGEGTLEALGGPNRSSLVTGPLGDPVTAEWRLSGSTAVVEMARASGLLLAGGSQGNDPLAATTAGTGELLADAVAVGARRIIVAVGGSATTDGGLAAIRAMEPLARFRSVSIEVACDVRLPFLEAARVFGPQKGASEAQVELLSRRLQRLADVYAESYGVDVNSLVGSGAAGGLAGGLAAVGANLVEGFEVVADETGLLEKVEGADLVVTGEGALDAESFDGKVVGGVIELAAEVGVPVLVIAGRVDPEVEIPHGVQAISLAERFGIERSMDDVTTCLALVAAEW